VLKINLRRRVEGRGYLTGTEEKGSRAAWEYVIAASAPSVQPSISMVSKSTHNAGGEGGGSRATGRRVAISPPAQHELVRKHADFFNDINERQTSGE
jgi:hypothetical protein